VGCFLEQDDMVIQKNKDFDARKKCEVPTASGALFVEKKVYTLL